MAMDKETCAKKLVDFYYCQVAPFVQGLPGPRKPLPVAFFKGDKLEEEALFLLDGEDSCELDVNGVKLTIVKGPLGSAQGWVVTILFP